MGLAEGVNGLDHIEWIVFLAVGQDVLEKVFLKVLDFLLLYMVVEIECSLELVALLVGHDGEI